jgi:hypothetical protein
MPAAARARAGYCAAASRARRDPRTAPADLTQIGRKASTVFLRTSARDQDKKKISPIGAKK